MNETITPARIVGSMIEAGAVRARLPALQLLVRSALAGAFLGVATTLAFTVLAQTGLPIVGALIFPVGFAMIVVLGLDLITGSFALLPMAVIAGRATVPEMLRNWAITFVGNYVGALVLALLMWVALTSAGHDTGGPVGDKIRGAVAARSAGYEALGTAGLLTVFVKAMLCNWMVCLGVTMAMMSTSTAGKLLGAWLPIFIFFAQGFEHAVVNMFVIPAGMMLGAKITFGDWWLWNQVPVTLGILAGGLLFIALPWFATYAPARGEMRAEASRAGASRTVAATP